MSGANEKLDKLAGDYKAISDKYGEGLNGKIAIVTGSNTGLGYEIARALAACGVRVFVASRNLQKGEPAAKELAEKDTSKAQVEYMHLDLASLKSVRTFAEDFRKLGLPLHILVNNASSWMVPESMSPTEDGFEYQAASYYFGHVYLTELLKDKLESSAPARLLWTTSASETLGTINWDNIELTDRTSNFATYGTMKMYGQMVARVYAKQLKSKKVSVYMGQPGMSSTDFFNPEKFSWYKPDATLQWLLQKFIGLTSEQGAWPIIFNAVAPEDQLQSAETGLSMGPEYYDTGVLQMPNITNKGLIRYQEPQNDNIKDYSTCERLYEATIKLLQRKPVVHNGPKLGNVGS
ncbi:hypothetical protein WJX73_001544 [Symbiochloris irregularis]|uniref:NAD(P)-binding protein n=1 Tax=Symbiochloris irregularis TaxID=706552 RepID=A0AAW1NTV0_9CHLO